MRDYRSRWFADENTLSMPRRDIITYLTSRLHFRHCGAGRRVPDPKGGVTGSPADGKDVALVRVPCECSHGCSMRSKSQERCVAPEIPHECLAVAPPAGKVTLRRVPCQSTYAVSVLSEPMRVVVGKPHVSVEDERVFSTSAECRSVPSKTTDTG